jgi:hypothetical protein
MLSCLNRRPAHGLAYCRRHGRIDAMCQAEMPVGMFRYSPHRVCGGEHLRPRSRAAAVRSDPRSHAEHQVNRIQDDVGREFPWRNVGAESQHDLADLAAVVSARPYGSVRRDTNKNLLEPAPQSTEQLRGNVLPEAGTCSESRAEAAEVTFTDDENTTVRTWLGAASDNSEALADPMNSPS